MGFQIYGFVFSLLEAKYNDKNIYFCIFNHGPKEEPNRGTQLSVKKFGLRSFSLDKSDVDKIKTITNNRYNRIVNGFIMEEDNIIIVFYMDNDLSYFLNFYDYDLNILAEKISINMIVEDPFYDGIFFKGVYLKEKYSALIYFLKHNKGTTLYLEILDFKLSTGNYGIKSILKKNIDKYNFATVISLNEFLKINSERLVYISTTNYKNLYILFFDLYNKYTILKTRVYFLNFPVYELTTELSACIYNNFLIFTGDAYYTNSPGIFSLFLMFGYPKGIDSIIDLSPFIFDLESYNPNLNLINILMENFVIENNLFHYEKVDKIRLDSIPEEIIFFNNENSNPLTEGDIVDKNYKLTYNKEIIKENKYYELRYQYILIEQNYSEFYAYEDKSINFNDSNYYIEFSPLTYYGRTNILKFKLCNDLCETCKIFGISNNNQQCLSCSPQLDYNYFTEKPLNCLPEGYLQDNEAKNILRCNETNHKFYYDIERNKTICFKYEYDCPYGYSNFNNLTKECLQSLFFNTIIYDYSNFTNEGILSLIVKDIIKNYNEKNNIIKGNNNIFFQITSGENEMKLLKGLAVNKLNLSIIDLGDCERSLRDSYNINENIPLIILKAEKPTLIISEKSVQYEVYNSETKERLDLSVCDSIKIVYPLALDEKNNNLFDNLNKLGYDMLNINDKFYQDICSPYETKDGTDMILSDRVNDIYNDNYSCPLNCSYSSFSKTKGALVCNCSIANENITLEDIGNLVVHSFKNIFHIINYKFIKCYKLVFHINVITKNFGGILCLLLFICYLTLLILYLINGIKPLIKSVNVFIKKKNKIAKKKFHLICLIIKLMNQINLCNLSQTKKNQIILI